MKTGAIRTTEAGQGHGLAYLAHLVAPTATARPQPRILDPTIATTIEERVEATAKERLLLSTGDRTTRSRASNLAAVILCRRTQGIGRNLMVSEEIN